MIDIMTGWWMASIAWFVAIAFMCHIIYALESDRSKAPLSLVFVIIISVFASCCFIAGICVAIFAKPLF